MKIVRALPLVLIILSPATTFSQTEIDYKVGKKLQPLHGGLHGANYSYQRKELDNGFHLVTSLIKGKDNYTLLYAKGGNFFRFIKNKESKENLKIDFKANHDSTDHYLSDVVFMNNDQLQLMFNHQSSGVRLIRFKKNKDRYIPFMYADILDMKGIRQWRNEQFATEILLDQDGSVLVKFDDQANDIYKIEPNQTRVKRNDVDYAPCSVVWYNDNLPDRLKTSDLIK